MGSIHERVEGGTMGCGGREGGDYNGKDCSIEGKISEESEEGKIK